MNMSFMRPTGKLIHFLTWTGLSLSVLILYGCRKTDFKKVVKLETGDIYEVGASYARVQGIIADLGEGVIEHGHCWSTQEMPDIYDPCTQLGARSEAGDYVSELTGLERNTEYFIRAYASTEEETKYGNHIFVPTFGLEDYEGNGYRTILIGEQEWMQENLRSRLYFDGSEIDSALAYDLNEDFVADYGRLYSWHAAMKGTSHEGAQGVCPSGWHIPSAGEVQMMLDYLGGNEAAHLKIMEEGTAHWHEDNPEVTNESGFTALPGGHFIDRPEFGFQEMGLWSNCWTSTAFNDQVASHFFMDRWSMCHVDLEPPAPEWILYSRRRGTFFAVRCVRDE